MYMQCICNGSISVYALESLYAHLETLTGPNFKVRLHPETHLAQESHIQGDGGSGLVHRMLALHLSSFKFLVCVPQEFVTLPLLLRRRLHTERER